VWNFTLLREAAKQLTKSIWQRRAFSSPKPGALCSPAKVIELAGLGILRTFPRTMFGNSTPMD
jgi:hypothetical protein